MQSWWCPELHLPSGLPGAVPWFSNLLCASRFGFSSPVSLRMQLTGEASKSRARVVGVDTMVGVAVEPPQQLTLGAHRGERRVSCGANVRLEKGRRVNSSERRCEAPVWREIEGKSRTLDDVSRYSSQIPYSALSACGRSREGERRSRPLRAFRYCGSSSYFQFLQAPVELVQ